MSLNEFMKAAHTELDAFESQWLANHEDDPEFWPDDMDSGDWWEHFLANTWTGNNDN